MVQPPAYDELSYQAESMVRDAFMKTPGAKQQVRVARKELGAAKAKVERSVKKRSK